MASLAFGPNTASGAFSAVTTHISASAPMLLARSAVISASSYSGSGYTGPSGSRNAMLRL